MRPKHGVAKLVQAHAGCSVRTSKFAPAQLADKANTVTARTFLDALMVAVPYRVEIVLTRNGIRFADLPRNRSGQQPGREDEPHHQGRHRQAPSVRRRGSGMS